MARAAAQRPAGDGDPRGSGVPERRPQPDGGKTAATRLREMRERLLAKTAAGAPRRRITGKTTPVRDGLRERAATERRGRDSEQQEPHGDGGDAESVDPRPATKRRRTHDAPRVEDMVVAATGPQPDVPPDLRRRLDDPQVAPRPFRVQAQVGAEEPRNKYRRVTPSRARVRIPTVPVDQRWVVAPLTARVLLVSFPARSCLHGLLAALCRAKLPVVAPIWWQEVPFPAMLRRVIV